MEVLIVIGLIWGFFALIGFITSSVSTGTDKGSEIIPFQARLRSENVDKGDTLFTIKIIEVKGLFPLSAPTDVKLIVSIFDKTSGQLEPVISLLEEFQEPQSIAYQATADIGQLKPMYGMTDWVKVGAIIPEMLQTPYGGHRQLLAYIRLINKNNPPNISNGFNEPDVGDIIWQQALEFNYEIKCKGYDEEVKHRDEAYTLGIKAAMTVALTDAQLHEEEGYVIKDWIQRVLSPMPENRRNHLKDTFNQAFKDAYRQAKQGQISLSSITARLNEIGDKSVKYEIIELCFDVMAADGKAEESELEIIRKLSDALGLDYGEIENMKDQRIVNLRSDHEMDSTNVDSLLGIKPDWDSGRIRAHLKSEFKKWNNRIATLTDGSERDNAQRMLDLIVEARKRYE